eukprot:TRINITY_DN72860_c0_g1_i1.p1 TRINITY_DN72860_c0_g1~~TRINITY_DN72860_c0_g1_i1.p1  ORF type:complete len:317 (+),score=41.87 TRINITY_DN72860_c0_g1_i1:105-1055(+)
MPRFACPTCNQGFMKWSACQHHLASVHLAAQPHEWQESCKQHGQNLPSLQVTIISASGDKFELQEICAVSDLKLSIAKHWQIPTDNQQLVICGCVLGDADSLLDFVSDDQGEQQLIISLVTSPAEPCESASMPSLESPESHCAVGASPDRPPGLFLQLLHSQSLDSNDPDQHEHVESLDLDDSLESVGAGEDFPGIVQQSGLKILDDLRPGRRPSKKMRLVCSKIVQDVMETYSNDPVRLCRAASFFSARSSYIKGLCKKHDLPLSCETVEQDEVLWIPKHILDLWVGFSHRNMRDRDYQWVNALAAVYVTFWRFF